MNSRSIFAQLHRTLLNRLYIINFKTIVKRKLIRIKIKKNIAMHCDENDEILVFNYYCHSFALFLAFNNFNSNITASEKSTDWLKLI